AGEGVARGARDEREGGPLAGLHRGDLRAQIAHSPARQAYVLPDEVDQGRIHAPAVLIFENRDLQSFRKNVGTHAAEDAADIEPVRHAARERDELALVKD